jgi:FKBP-type peptidyl-prolyl cis-trans isomerase FkpA
MNSIKVMFLCCVVFMVACKDKKELMTKSGYAYEYTTNGSGKTANVGDYMGFTYKVTGSDGVVLEEKGEGPQMPIIKVPTEEQAAKNATNPIMELLVKSAVGDVYDVIMPIDSIPMPNRIPAYDSLSHITYEVSIKNVWNEEEYKAHIDGINAASLEKSNAIGEKVKAIVEEVNANVASLTSTESGLKYIIHEEGTGENAKAGDYVSVDYYGVLAANGEKFDDSFSKGRSFDFSLGQGQVIQGWDEGLTYLKKGSKATLFIPYTLAYGEAGYATIPEKADLIFYVELNDIMSAK